MYTAAYSAAMALGLVAFVLVMGTELVRRIEKSRSG
jgi:hypothetical protein